MTLLLFLGLFIHCSLSHFISSSAVALTSTPLVCPKRNMMTTHAHCHVMHNIIQILLFPRVANKNTIFLRPCEHPVALLSGSAGLPFILHLFVQKAQALWHMAICMLNCPNQCKKRNQWEFWECTLNLHVISSVSNICTYTCIPYSGKFSWVQILAEMTADAPEENLVVFILVVCSRQM